MFTKCIDNFFTTEHSCHRGYSCTIKLSMPSTLLRHGLAHLVIQKLLSPQKMQVTSFENLLSLTCFWTTPGNCLGEDCFAHLKPCPGHHHKWCRCSPWVRSLAFIQHVSLAGLGSSMLRSQPSPHMVQHMALALQDTRHGPSNNMGTAKGLLLQPRLCAQVETKTKS